MLRRTRRPADSRLDQVQGPNVNLISVCIAVANVYDKPVCSFVETKDRLIAMTTVRTGRYGRELPVWLPVRLMIIRRGGDR